MGLGGPAARGPAEGGLAEAFLPHSGRSSSQWATPSWTPTQTPPEGAPEAALGSGCRCCSRCCSRYCSRCCSRYCSMTVLCGHYFNSALFCVPKRDKCVTIATFVTPCYGYPRLRVEMMLCRPNQCLRSRSGTERREGVAGGRAALMGTDTRFTCSMVLQAEQQLGL